jgi:hypothetical protein
VWFWKTMGHSIQWLRAPAAIASFSLLVFVALIFLVYRYHYPYGARPACLPVLVGALRSYSLEHEGFFPNDGEQPLEALRKLYPRYLPDCEPLAGLSGNRELLKREIVSGGKVTKDASSWVYWPGLRSDDDEQIAVVWERESGIRFNGSRAHGREVGFVNGVFRQVPDDRWADFLKEQERLREKAIKSRNGERIPSQNHDAPGGSGEDKAQTGLRLPNKSPERMSAQVAGWRSDGCWGALIAQLDRSAYCAL